jgi:hypothetical protein
MANAAPEAGVVVVGIVLMFLARFVLRSSFFGVPQDSAALER